MWGDTTKTRSPIHKDSENFAYTCIIGRSSKQKNYFQIGLLIRSQHKVIYMTIMKHNPNYLRSKCVSISTIFLFYQYFIMFLNRTVICVLPFKNHNQNRYLFSNVIKMCSQLIQIDIGQNYHQHVPYHLVNVI